MKKLIEQIVGDKIIAILRNVPDEHLMTVVGTLLDDGIRCIEVTLNSSGALEQIARLAEGFEDCILLGA